MRNTLYFFFFPLLLLSVLAVWIQNHVFLSNDVGYLFYISKNIFAGAAYGSDFFETNPPMILYLYHPIWLIKKITSFDVAASIRLYVFIFAMGSIGVSYVLLKRVIRDRLTLFFLFLVMVFIFLFIPTYHFGQREHLFLMLSMPYFILSALRIEKKNINPFFAGMIGLAAGVGFCIKPYFLFPLVLIELYFIFHTRRLFGWVRIETVTIAIVLAGYLASIYIFQPSYIHEILPLVSDFYFVGVKQPWIAILLDDITIFCLAALMSYIFWRKQDRYSALSKILILALGGNIIAYFVPHTPWFYHKIPALALASLLLALFFGQFVFYRVAKSLGRMSVIKNGIFFTLTFVIIFYVPLSNFGLMVSGQMHDKNQSPRAQLISYINAIPGKHSVNCFSFYTTRDCFPLVFDTNSDYASRYPFFWWYRGVVKLSGSQMKLPENLEKPEQYLMQAVVDDLNHLRARWVIMDMLTPQYEYGKKFVFLQFFLKDKNFRAAWKQYHYLTSIGYYDVYERNAKKG